MQGGEVEDLTLGCALTQGTTGVNVARHAAQVAGLPDSVAGATVDRQCATGLSAISIAANQVVNEGLDVALAGGLDSISLVQNPHWNGHRYKDPAVAQAYYMPIIETAEVVAKRYGISHQAQDEYALQSQQRTLAAQQAGLFNDEIIAVETMTTITDKASGDSSETSVTAGNASQLSDAASACVIMEKAEAAPRAARPTKWASVRLSLFRACWNATA